MTRQDLARHQWNLELVPRMCFETTSSAHIAVRTFSDRSMILIARRIFGRWHQLRSSPAAIVGPEAGAIPAGFSIPGHSTAST
jgi:hypothetical protein